MMRKYLYLLLFPFFLCVCPLLKGQHLETSHLLWNRPVYNNAALTSNNYSRIVADFRQTQSSGINFNSAMFWMDYPILIKNKNTGAFFLMLENEKSGSSNDFNTFRANAALSKKIRIHKYSHIQFGLGMGYAQYKLSLGGLTTSSQYIEDSGFSSSLPNGETGLYQTSYFTINSGFSYQTMDYSQSQILKIGVSANNLNKQIQNWENIVSKLPVQVSIQSQYLTFIHPNWGVGPDLVLFNEGNNFNGIGGMTFRYFLENPGNSIENEGGKHLNTFIRVASQKKGILGLQYKSENYVVGFSYDFPFGNLSQFYGNTFEVLIAFTPKINGRFRKKKSKGSVEKPNPSANKFKQQEENATVPSRTATQESSRGEKTEVASDTLQNANESKGNVKAGMITSQKIGESPQVNKVYFVFGSSELEEDSKAYLREIFSRYMIKNDFKIRITGHTDNIGSEEKNIKLSLERAKKVNNYLKKLGVTQSDIVIEGKGEEEPISSNATMEGRAKNRRVEIKLIPK